MQKVEEEKQPCKLVVRYLTAREPLKVGRVIARLDVQYVDDYQIDG